MAFSLVLAAIDSGVVSVFAKQTFEAVPDRRLNFAVALLGSMEAFANILSFVWSGIGHGRAKIRIINALQVAVVLLVASIAFLPRTEAGLYGLVCIVLLARTCWSGIITLRPTVWRANYPADLRARIVGRFSMAQVLTVALIGMLLGRLLDSDLFLFRVAVPIACVLGLAAVGLTASIRVRREGTLLKKEHGEHGSARRLRPWEGFAPMVRVLKQDKRYAQFMICMFVLGFGNLMVTPILAITLREEFSLSYFWSILITTTTPQIMILLMVPFWARFLDRSHVVLFRSIHSWTFVSAGVVFLIGAIAHMPEFMFAANALMGLGYAGGTLAWNLGHVDFSPPAQTSQYMAAHVTLNGVRGLLAPLLAVALYEALKAIGLDAAVWVYSVSLCVSIAGAAGFVALRRSMGRQVEQDVRRGG